MDSNTDNGIKKLGNPIVVFLIFLALGIFLVFALIPQDFWVKLSIKTEDVLK